MRKIKNIAVVLAIGGALAATGAVLAAPANATVTPNGWYDGGTYPNQAECNLTGLQDEYQGYATKFTCTQTGWQAWDLQLWQS